MNIPIYLEPLHLEHPKISKTPKLTPNSRFLELSKSYLLWNFIYIFWDIWFYCFEKSKVHCDRLALLFPVLKGIPESGVNCYSYKYFKRTYRKLWKEVLLLTLQSERNDCLSQFYDGCYDYHDRKHGMSWWSVSYTHLTLPTIYSV